MVFSGEGFGFLQAEGPWISPQTEAVFLPVRRNGISSRETLSGNRRRPCTLLSLAQAGGIEWMPAKNGNRKRRQGGQGGGWWMEGKGQAKSCTTVWTPLPPLAAQSGAPDSCRAGTKLPLRHPPQQLPRQLEHQFPAKTAVPHRRLLQAALFKQLKTIPLAACTSTRDPAVLVAPLVAGW